MITSFRGEYVFLSNFYPAAIRQDELIFMTNEHFFQYHKTLSPKERLEIINAPTPFIAKKRGRNCTLRPDWEDLKYGVMKNAIKLKFERGGLMAAKLLATGTETLLEGNNWGDRYWGAIWNGKNWEGENKLGVLLMERRSWLKYA